MAWPAPEKALWNPVRPSDAEPLTSAATAFLKPRMTGKMAMCADPTSADMRDPLMQLCVLSR